MDSLKDKFWQLNHVFDEYPKVYWCVMLHMVSAVVAVFSYMPLVEAIANFNVMGITPLKSLIVDNWEVLRWGIVLFPVGILLFGWIRADELHDRLMRKKYRF